MATNKSELNDNFVYEIMSLIYYPCTRRVTCTSILKCVLTIGISLGTSTENTLKPLQPMIITSCKGSLTYMLSLQISEHTWLV